MNLGFALTGAGAETLVPLGIAIFGGNMGEFKMVPIWFFDIFPYNVWEYGISDVFSLCRNILLA